MLRNTTYFIIIITLIFVECTVDNSKNRQEKINSKTNLKEVQSRLVIKRITETTYDGIDKFGEILKRDMKLASITYNNEKGKMIECSNTNFISNQKSKNIYKYDDKNNLISYDTFDSNGNLDSKGVYKNDDKGYITEVNVYNSTGTLITKSKFKTDNQGNIIESNIYNSNGNLMNKIISKFDEKNQEMQKYFYDKNGKLESPLNFEYKKYDFAGNWLIKIEEVFNSYYLIEREIEYF